MGTLTYTELEEEVRSALGSRTDLDSRLTRFINLGQTRLARMKRWEELERLFTLTLPLTGDPNSDKFVTFSGDVRDVYSVRMIDGTQSRKLTRRTFRTFDRIVPDPGAYSRSRPMWYTVWNSTMELYPIQDQAYPLEARAIVWPAPFTGTAAPNQVSELDRKDDLIVALSLIYAFRRQQDFDQADKWISIARGLIAESSLEEDERPDLDPLPGPGVGDMPQTNYWQDPFSRRMP